jgi:hypothetical protein
MQKGVGKYSHSFAIFWQSFDEDINIYKAKEKILPRSY